MIRTPLLSFGVSCALVLVSTPAAAQSAQTSQPFVGSLIRFLEAVGGRFGDEGIELRVAVASMEDALIAWDANIWVYETVMADRLADAEPRVAAEMHSVVGALYLERGRTADAIDELVAAAGLDPARSDVHALLGLAYEAAGRHADAVAAFRQAAERDPTDPVPVYQLGRLLLRIGDADRADEEFRRVQPLVEARLAAAASDEVAAPFLRVALLEETPDGDPFFPPAAYAEAFARLGSGDLEEAVVQFRAAVDRDPLASDPALATDAMVQGAAALRAGDLARALDHLRVAAAQAPDSAEVHRILGTAYRFDRQYGNSVRHLELAIELGADDERAYLALVDTLMDAAQATAAETALRQALDELPQAGAFHYELGRLYERLQRQDEALRAFEAAAALGPLAGSHRLYTAIGRSHLNQMSLEGAARAYRTLLRIDPNSADVHRALGEVYRSQGRLDAALAEFPVALLIDPNDAVATAAAGQTHLEAGRPDEALPLLRRAVELDSVLPDARYALGTSLVRLGRIDEGRQELDVFARLQAEALAQERLAYETNLRRLEAGVRREEGAHDEAAALWAQVVERAPDAASDRIELGLALTRIGRDEHAVAQFLRALALDADADVHGHLAAAYERLGRLEESREQQALHERWKGDRVATLGAAR